MGKIVNWILGFTKLGKIVEPIQLFLSGYKSYIAGAGLLIPSLLTMIQGFTDQGASYLMGVTSTQEWALFMNGLAVFGIRAGISKATK